MIETFSILTGLLHSAILLLFGLFLMTIFLKISTTPKNVFILGILYFAIIFVQLLLFISFGREAVIKWYPMITHLPLILFFVIFFRSRLFLTVLSMTIAYLCCQIVHWLELVLEYFKFSGIAIDLMTSILLAALAFFIMIYFAPSISRLLDHENKELAIYAVIPFTYYLYDYVTTVYTDHFQIPATLSMEFMPFVLSFVFLIFSTVYHKQYEARFEAIQKSQILSMQLKQYESMRAKMEETRIARHDLRQHLRLMTAYLENNDIESLTNYIKSYGESMPDESEQKFCDNTVVNTLVRYYSVKAQEHQIQFDVHLCIPEIINILEPDLCVLLGNLLENALDECMRHPQESCCIKLAGRLRGTRTLIITVDNSPALKPSVSDHILLSSKPSRSGAGIGTSSIRNIAERYHGEAKFEWRQRVFYASVILTLPM